MSLLTSKVRDEYWEFELELIANLLQPFKVPQKIWHHICFAILCPILIQFSSSIVWSKSILIPCAVLSNKAGEWISQDCKTRLCLFLIPFLSSICQWSICFDLPHLLLIYRSALVPRLEGNGGHIQNTSIWNLPSTKGSTLIILKFKACKLGSAPARKWKGTGGGRQELNFWPKNPSSLSRNPSRPQESSLRWHNWLGKP